MASPAIRTRATVSARAYSTPLRRRLFVARAIRKLRGMGKRDVAIVLSGGAVNGVLMELGFLKRLRESELWPRIGWIYGTSAGALSGTMAALDRLDELEGFMLRLQPEDPFRPHSLWRLPLLGSHDYRLPETVAARIGDIEQ